MPKRPFTRSEKDLKEDMLATPTSCEENTQPTAPDIRILADDSSDGGEHKNLTETNAIPTEAENGHGFSFFFMHCYLVMTTYLVIST